LEACAVICRKATVARPDANPCLFEHKIEVFVSECAIFPRFWAVLTQNRHFCALLPASFFPMAPRHGAPASNKPHPAEKSTPVWLAIWRTWAGFANSQLLSAAFRSTY
jgi:hypothetical protein